MNRAALAAAIVGALAGVARAQLAPIAVIDGDYRVDPHEAEGFDGFDLARMQLGARGDLGTSLSATGLVDFANGESPTIIDAYVEWHPCRCLDLSAGYLRSPLFISARDEFVERLPVPELAATVTALWPARAVGLGARWRPDQAPIDVWARVANGANDVSGNDTNTPAFDGRIDYVVGRPTAHVSYGHLKEGSRANDFGLRVGVGAHWDDVDDRPGAAGVTASGYQFYRPATVAGHRYVVEGHALAQYDALQLLVEGGYTREDRKGAVTADPSKPRPALDAVESYGVSAELSYMITGDHRIPGTWPRDPGRHHGTFDGALEVAGRAERVSFGHCATGAAECLTAVERLSANIASLAVRWWVRPETAVSLAAYSYHWDNDPFDQPGVRSTYLLLARLTLSIR